MSETYTSRLGDPETSKAAAESIDPSKIERAVLAALRVRSMTAEEIAEHTKIRLGSITPRMRPLEKREQIERTDEKRKGESGRGRIVWRLKTHQPGEETGEPLAGDPAIVLGISPPAPAAHAGA